MIFFLQMRLYNMRTIQSGRDMILLLKMLNSAMVIKISGFSMIVL